MSNLQLPTYVQKARQGQQSKQTKLIPKKLNLDFDISKYRVFGPRIILEMDLAQRFVEVLPNVFFDIVTGDRVNPDGSKSSSRLLFDDETMATMQEEMILKMQDSCYFKVVKIGGTAFQREGLEDALHPETGLKVGDIAYVKRCHAEVLYDKKGNMTKYFVVNETKLEGAYDE